MKNKCFNFVQSVQFPQFQDSDSSFSVRRIPPIINIRFIQKMNESKFIQTWRRLENSTSLQQRARTAPGRNSTDALSLYGPGERTLRAYSLNLSCVRRWRWMDGWMEKRWLAKSCDRLRSSKYDSNAIPTSDLKRFAHAWTELRSLPFFRFLIWNTNTGARYSQ